jgi:ribokinase
MVFAGANGRLTKAAVDDAATRVAPMRVVVTQLEIPDEAVAAAGQIAKRSGALFVLDPAPARPLPDAQRAVRLMRGTRHGCVERLGWR